MEVAQLATLPAPALPPYRISLGPLLYYWTRDETLDFYAAVTGSAVDIVYLGETVCSRRHEMRPVDWLDLAAVMRESGKTVVLSTRTLVESSGEAVAIRRLCEQEGYLVETGDIGAVAMRNGKPFVAGPHMNAYNGDTLRWLRRQGAVRFVAPLEMDRVTLRRLIAEKPQPLEAEVMVWGRMPLAFSARCFTARHFKLRKDECEYRCSEHPDGLGLRTRDSQNFLAINGIQMQSAACLDLLEQAPALAETGVNVLRVSPQSSGTLQAIAALHALRAGRVAAAVSTPFGIDRCNGYWHGRPGFELVQESI